jgi:hypothetical protein
MLAVALVGWPACGTQKEEPPRPVEATGGSQQEAEDEKNDARQKELSRIEQEARDAIDKKAWPGARQIIGEGLRLSEDQRGLELEAAKLLLLLGDVERESGNEVEARRHYTDAMAVFHVNKDDRGRFETLLSTSQLEARRGDYSAAERELSEAETYIPKLKDRKLVGQFKMVKGWLASRQVKHQEAYDTFLEAIQIFEAGKDYASRAEALLLLAAEEDALGQLEASKRSLEKALSTFNEKEDLDGKVRALHRLATYAERERKFGKARQLFKEVLTLYEQLDQKSTAANVRQHLNALPVPESESKKKK